MEIFNLPELPDNNGEKGKAIDIDGEKVSFTILDEIRRIQTKYPDKVKTPNKAIYFQRFRFDKDGREEFRLGYYMIGKRGNKLGKWTWGQYCPMVPKEDFEAIIKEAIKRGWIKSLGMR